MKEIGSEKSTPQCPFYRGGRGVQSYWGNTHQMEATHLKRGKGGVAGGFVPVQLGASDVMERLTLIHLHAKY